MCSEWCSQLVHETPGGRVELWRVPMAHEVMVRILQAREAANDSASRGDFPDDWEVFSALTAILRSPLHKDQLSLVQTLLADATFMKSLLSALVKPVPQVEGKEKPTHGHAVRFFLAMIEALDAPLRTALPCLHA